MSLKNLKLYLAKEWMRFMLLCINNAELYLGRQPARLTCPASCITTVKAGAIVNF